MFPWNNNEKPIYVDEENNIEWYNDKTITEWCAREYDNFPPLNAMGFILAKNKEPVNRVLIDVETNQIIIVETSLEAMAVKIDLLRFMSI